MEGGVGGRDQNVSRRVHPPHAGAGVDGGASTSFSGRHGQWIVWRDNQERPLNSHNVAAALAAAKAAASRGSGQGSHYHGLLCVDNTQVRSP